MADADQRKWRVRVTWDDGRAAGVVFYGNQETCERIAEQLVGKPLEEPVWGIPMGVAQVAVAEPDPGP